MYSNVYGNKYFDVKGCLKIVCREVSSYVLNYLQDSCVHDKMSLPHREDRLNATIYSPQTYQLKIFNFCVTAAFILKSHSAQFRCSPV